MSGQIISGNLRVTTITDSGIRLPLKKKGFFSVFAFDGDAKAVSITGAKYEIKNRDLSGDISLGVSNEFVGVEPVISVEDGTLLIMWYENE